MEKKTIEPSEWNPFLAEFSRRNQARRSRFEVFTGDEVAEEDEEATFENIAIDSGVVTVKRRTARGRDISSDIENVRGIVIQFDSDKSENTMEFMDSNGDITVLHFESRVDGDS